MFYFCDITGYSLQKEMFNNYTMSPLDDSIIAMIEFMNITQKLMCLFTMHECRLISFYSCVNNIMLCNSTHIIIGLLATGRIQLQPK
jgi:hypothetical protein